MGVRPPANDIDDEPDSVEFGIVALDARLEKLEVSFPTTAEELAADYGGIRIAVDPGGNEIAFGEALKQCGRTEFRTEQELLNALHPVFERKREAVSNSLIGRLRTLVPF